MGDQLVIRIDRKMKEKFYEPARMEGKSASEKVREMVETYIRIMDIGPVVDDLWERIGSELRDKGVDEGDVRIYEGIRIVTPTEFPDLREAAGLWHSATP